MAPSTPPPPHHLATPLATISMFAQMLYVLEQRLAAQAIPIDKSRRVLRELCGAFFQPHLMGELFVPGPMHPPKALRAVFDRLAHASICRLNEASMDKLFDLMVMGLKRQLLRTPPTSAGLIGVTAAHIDALAVMVGGGPPQPAPSTQANAAGTHPHAVAPPLASVAAPSLAASTTNSSAASSISAAAVMAAASSAAIAAAAADSREARTVLSHMEACRALLQSTYGGLTHGDVVHLRRALLSFVQDRNVKVSLFLASGAQRGDGVFVLEGIIERGVLPLGVETPGIVRYWGPQRLHVVAPLGEPLQQGQQGKQTFVSGGGGVPGSSAVLSMSARSIAMSTTTTTSGTGVRPSGAVGGSLGGGEANFPSEMEFIAALALPFALPASQCKEGAEAGQWARISENIYAVGLALGQGAAATAHPSSSTGGGSGGSAGVGPGAVRAAQGGGSNRISVLTRGVLPSHATADTDGGGGDDGSDDDAVIPATATASSPGIATARGVQLQSLPATTAAAVISGSGTTSRQQGRAALDLLAALVGAGGGSGGGGGQAGVGASDGFKLQLFSLDVGAEADPADGGSSSGSGAATLTAAPTAAVNGGWGRKGTDSSGGSSTALPSHAQQLGTTSTTTTTTSAAHRLASVAKRLGLGDDEGEVSIGGAGRAGGSTGTRSGGEINGTGVAGGGGSGEVIAGKQQCPGGGTGGSLGGDASGGDALDLLGMMDELASDA